MTKKWLHYGMQVWQWLINCSIIDPASQDNEYKDNDYNPIVYPNQVESVSIWVQDDGICRQIRTQNSGPCKPKPAHKSTTFQYGILAELKRTRFFICLIPYKNLGYAIIKHNVYVKPLSALMATLSTRTPTGNFPNKKPSSHTWIHATQLPLGSLLSVFTNTLTKATRTYIKAQSRTEGPNP